MSRFPIAILFAVAVTQLPSRGWCATYWLAPTAAVWMQDKADKPAADSKVSETKATDAKAATDPNAATEPRAATDPKALQELLDRISKLEAEVERLKNGAPAQAKGRAAGGEVLTLVEAAHLGVVYQPNGQSRFVALQLIVVNTTDKPVTLAQDQISAEIDGQVRKLETIPPDFVSHGFQHKGQGYTLQSMQPEKTRTVPAGGQVTFWLVFPKLGMTNTIPKCKVQMSLGEARKEIDVNAVQRAMLGLETRRIGPRGCLALLTIQGTMTMFNTQSLVDELDQLVASKVARVVVRWSPDAPQPDGQILNWLQNSTANLGQARNANDMFPSIPSSLREFHLVRFSDKVNTSSSYRGNGAGPSRMHANSADAVGAALQSAYVALPRDELLQEIREGDPLTRAAALSYGGARLDAEHLPQIFQWIEDKDIDVQKAALQTLSHFGEPEAVEKLVFYVKRNVEPLSSTAIESLAGSRFGSAHEALLQLLANETPESKKRIVQVLARYPRPVWSETLYEFASDSREGLNLDAVKALVQVGHPKLIDILEAGLKGTDTALRDFCFQTLSNRTDERSEKLAVDYTLEHLKSGPPEGTMTQLLARTKDPRALPLLLERLDQAGGDRSSVITLLVQMGDQTVGDKLAQKYPSLQNSAEKAQILNGLRQFRHPKFREFAGAALLSSDGSLVSTAATTLMQEGHPEGEKLLIAALDKQTTAHLLHNITNALANYGTPTARAALQKAKESGDANKKNYASNALLQIRQRSPGFLYVSQGIQRLQAQVDPKDAKAKAQQEKDALEFFDLAMQLDPQMAEAYAARGKVYLRQDKLVEAGKDFEKALELKLEPDDSEVVTGLALSRVVQGKIEDAVKLIEDGREKFKNVRGGLYLYNCACVYSRSVNYLQEHKDVADASARIDEYRKKSLADLEQSIKQGFADFDWMAKDPDFTSLRDDPGFKKLLAARPVQKPGDDEEEKKPEP